MSCHRRRVRPSRDRGRSIALGTLAGLAFSAPCAFAAETPTRDAASATATARTEAAAEAVTPDAVTPFVTWTVAEGHEKHDAFPSTPPSPTWTWTTPSMLLGVLPQVYDEHAVRRDWNGRPVLTGTAVIALPGGPVEWLVRAPGLSRLSLDGETVLTTKPIAKNNGAHNDVPAVPHPEPGVRDPRIGDQELRSTRTMTEGLHTVRVESVLGQEKRRSEPGELTVAFREPGGAWRVVTGAEGGSLPLTDAAVAAYLVAEDARTATLDRLHRRQVDADAAAWDRRHDEARARIAGQAAPVVPEVAGVSHPIDRFLAARRQAVAAGRSAPADPAGAAPGRDDPLPAQAVAILTKACNRCHGEKAKGELRLDGREAALAGGESGEPALVAGHADRSKLIAALGPDADQPMPPTGDRLTDAERAILARWVDAGAAWPTADGPKRPAEATDSDDVASKKVSPAATEPAEIAPRPIVDDLTFARRASLDLAGVVPAPELVADYLARPAETRRTWLVDRLLGDPRWADHQTAYWQDVLAENPSLLKPTLNNTGPFRFHLREAMEDNRPLDRFAAELVRMEGAAYSGGPGGFAIATENDVPMAERAHVLAGAFLGIEVKCARCHDAPYHASTQRDLFEFAALLAEKPITLPKTSSVPKDAMDRAAGKIRSTLAPGQKIAPRWPFFGEADVAYVEPVAVGKASSAAPRRNDAEADDAAEKAPAEGSPAGADTDTASSARPADAGETKSTDHRLRDEAADRLTDPLTSPFAKVLANRFWAKLMGTGLVEPVADWEGATPSHPELLEYLARTLIESGYDAKALTRLIVTSDAYAREAVDEPGATPETRLFLGPTRRMMTAEQVVDSLYVVAGRPMEVEELNFDADGREIAVNFGNFGRPTRAFEMVSLSNERDRPALALPRAQAVVDVLEAFGWRPSRAEPLTRCQPEPNLVMPATLGGGTLVRDLTTVTDGSRWVETCRDASSPGELADRLFLAVLTRSPTDAERAAVAELLAPGFADRVEAVGHDTAVPPRTPTGRDEAANKARRVTWSNHLSPEASEYRLADAEMVAAGPVPTDALDPAWRERVEDALWTIVNLPEFVFVP